MARQKIETKKLRIYARSKRDAKKLARLEADGWTIQTQAKSEDLLGRDTGHSTLVLVREKVR